MRKIFFIATSLLFSLLLYSCINEEKEYVIEDSINEEKEYVIEDSGLSYYRITKGNKHGIIDSEDGEIVVPVQFDSVVHLWQSSGKDIGLEPMDWFVAFKDGIAELYSPNGNIVISRSQGYEGISPNLFRTSVYESLWYSVEQNGKRGLCNSKGNCIIPCRYESIHIRRIPQCVLSEKTEYGMKYGMKIKKTNNGETVYQEDIIYCKDRNTKTVSVYDVEGMIVIQSGIYSEIDDISSIGTYYFECKDNSNGFLSIMSKHGKMMFEDDALLIEHKASNNGNVYFLSYLNDSDDLIIYDCNGRRLFRGSRDDCEDYVYYNL